MKHNDRIKAFNNHPAIEFANSRIMLDAARTGGSGWEGESLADFVLTQFEEIDTEWEEKIKGMRDFHSDIDCKEGYCEGYKDCINDLLK